MTKARGVFGLQLAVGGLGAGAVLLALGVATSAITLQSSGGQGFLTACRKFVLPDLSIGAILALALGSVAFAVLALAVRSAHRQHRAQRQFLAGLAVRGPAPVGPPGTRLLADPRPRAFCTGLARPRIYVSDGALRVLAPDELAAVLAHEAHHARYRDPLRIFFARVLSDALFFLPVLRRLADRYAALAEIAADASAVRASHNDTRPLAAALLAFDQSADRAVVGIAPERVDHLLGERQRWELPLALLAWAVVVVGALVVVAIRTAQATAGAPLDLPLLGQQLCMLIMAIAPVVAGAAVLLWGRRLVRIRGAMFGR